MENRIKNLSLDQKAKLYYMALLQKGMIDTLPEDPKAAYVQSMMDEPASSKFSEPMGETRDEEDEENDRNLALDDIPDSLRELSTELGYLNEEKNCGCGKNPCETYGTMNEEVDEQGLDQIEMGLNQITGGGRQSAGVSDRGDKIRVMFRYMRGEFDGETWDTFLKYLSDNSGYKILEQSNYYEANYDREEPAEAVPMIYLQK